jgi:hypothetical protein
MGSHHLTIPPETLLEILCEKINSWPYKKNFNILWRLTFDFGIKKMFCKNYIFTSILKQKRGDLIYKCEANGALTSAMYAYNSIKIA